MATVREHRGERGSYSIKWVEQMLPGRVKQYTASTKCRRGSTLIRRSGSTLIN